MNKGKPSAKVNVVSKLEEFVQIHTTQNGSSRQLKCHKARNETENKVPGAVYF